MILGVQFGKLNALIGDSGFALGVMEPTRDLGTAFLNNMLFVQTTCLFCYHYHLDNWLKMDGWMDFTKMFGGPFCNLCSSV